MDVVGVAPTATAAARQTNQVGQITHTPKAAPTVVRCAAQRIGVRSLAAIALLLSVPAVVLGSRAASLVCCGRRRVLLRPWHAQLLRSACL